MTKKPFFPHWVFPRFWGGSGPSYEEEVANYYYEGEDLERALINIHHTDKNKRELEHLKLDKKYGLVDDEYEYELNVARLQHGEDSKEYKIAKVESDWAEGELSDLEKEEKIATINEEPWVNVSAELVETGDGRGISIVPKYNRYFIEYLKKNGYSPLLEEDELVRIWLTDFYASVLNGDEDVPNEDDDLYE